MPDDPPRVLLVEDDVELAAMLLRLLTGAGYEVEHIRDGHTGLHHGLTRRYDVMIIDRGLPAVDGLDLIGRLRAKGITVPVLVLSAFSASADRVAGLDAGAEDYLGKPFDVAELLARLRALRRRHLTQARSLPLNAALRMDLDARVVTGAGDPVELSERECALLALMAANPKRVYSRADLLSLVFTDASTDAAVDTYVHYVRRKVGRGVIATVHGRGYRLGKW
jgi:two-component system response regulator QseB